MRTTNIAVAAFVLLVAAAAQAHVTLDPASAPAGSVYKASFRITHGCKGSPTTGVAVLIPEGVQGARPMPKPGWTLDTKTEKLGRPYESHGRRIVEDVIRVSWSGGNLANSEFDEFVLLVRLPQTVGKLYFKVVQSCAQGVNEWVQIPQAGKSAHDYPSPAVELELTPAGGTRHHH